MEFFIKYIKKNLIYQTDVADNIFFICIKQPT